MDEFFRENPWLGIALTILGLAAFIGLVIYTGRKQRRVIKAKAAERDTNQIAQIDEIETFTSGGVAALVMLVIFNVFSFAGFMIANGAIQQAVAALIWIGWNVVWGLGAILGRQRSYRVYRTPPTE